MWLHSCTHGGSQHVGILKMESLREQDTMRRSSRENWAKIEEEKEDLGGSRTKKVGTTGAGTRAANYWFNLLLFFVRKNGYIS